MFKKRFNKLNKGILYTTLFLVVFGLFIFFSASLSSVKDMDFFIPVFFKQLIAVTIGLAVMFYIANSKKITGLWLRTYSAYMFIAALTIQLLVVIPGTSLELKGAKRWADLGIVSIQPSEIFKYFFIIFFVAIVTTLGIKLRKFKTFAILSLVLLVPLSAFFFYIRDLGTLLGILFSVAVVFLISKAHYRYVIIPAIAGFVILLPLLYFFVPYVNERLEVYINPENVDLQDSHYQLNQMKITIGSGEITGRGFGSSLQKFSGLLPEPLGDSIFPVYSEEFGFVGSVFLILLFLILLFFILYSAKGLKNNFEIMVVAGLGILIVFPAFYNIAASLGIVPLSGMPITFISKGGTAIFAALLTMGIILNITRKKR